ncbi:hypothetical protein SNEBB_002517 [Seison nebaliae]|nr:hypothetical protein SNEBB_002517 [Seison nebaliae]
MFTNKFFGASINIARNKLVSTNNRQSSNFEGNEDNGNITRERSYNRVELMGRVGQDPQFAGNDTHPVALFSLATNEYMGRDKENGQKRFRTDWHRISVFNKVLHPVIENYVRKGNRIFVTGKLHYSLVDGQEPSQKRYVTNIIADQLIFLNSTDKTE